MDIPHDIPAERAVLGAILLDREAILPLRDKLSETDFYLERHGMIYAAALRCVERKVPPDLSTISSELRAVGHLELVGGLGYLAELSGDAPIGVHAEHYAQPVITTAARRRIIEMGAQITALAYDQRTSLDSIQQQIATMSELQRRAAAGNSAWQSAVVSARALYRMQLPETPWIIDKILPAGTMIITGKPKTRKSWLAANLAWSVAAGGKALGQFQAQMGDALYIDLEMGAKRIQRRMKAISPNEPPPKGLNFATEWPRVGEGFETWLTDYIEHNPFTRLVVVDTLVAIRPSRGRNEDLYEFEKGFTQKLTNLTQALGIAVILIHHSRKADGSDLIDDASGSTGLTGGVDNYATLRLDRNDNKLGSLSFKGRDIELEDPLNLRWDSQIVSWRVTDEQAGGPRITAERQAVLDLLESVNGLRANQIAQNLGRDESGTRRLLSDMAKAGLIEHAQGYYRLPDDGYMPPSV